MRKCRVALVGSGFMGRCHAQAFKLAPVIFPLKMAPELVVLADRDMPTATRAAEAFDFVRASGDWREVVTDPDIDLIDITAPNTLHKPIALAAIDAGKSVYCEKPLAPNLSDARDMADAAAKAGVATFVGFNYLRNPIVSLAKELIEAGELGEIWSFRGIHAEDYMRDPRSPWTWRLDPAGGAGALADLGSHIISTARYLVGDIVEVSSDLRTVIKERPDPHEPRRLRPVETNDEARAIVRFANGARGVIEASWVASGRSLYHAFEIYGSKGALLVDHERFNELHLYLNCDPRGRDGFKRISAGPQHKDYAAFCPAPGHQLGFNDLKTIEVKDVLESLDQDTPFFPDFGEAVRVQAVVEAILKSADARQWVSIDEL